MRDAASIPMSRDDEAIYQRPDEYDLEREGDDEDIDFHVDLVRRLRPRRLLELASGSGRVTLPLAELAAKEGFDVVGLETSESMREEAERKRAAAPAAVRDRLRFVEGDMRTWVADAPYDLIVTPCSSVCHLLTLDDQIAAWTRAREGLRPGGRFAVDVVMADLASYAESLRTPPRTLADVDIDVTDDEGRRLIRWKTTVYEPHRQRASVRFVYDKFTADQATRHPERWISDFESHVFFPRELELLFRHTGFTVEATFADYRFKAPGSRTRNLVMIGRRD
jgi:SAM-dependent methyltransferase